MSAAAFDQPGGLQPVQRVSDAELLLLLSGADGVPEVVFGERALVVVATRDQDVEHGAVVVVLMRGGGVGVLGDLVVVDGGVGSGRQVVPGWMRPATRRRLKLAGTWPGVLTMRSTSASEIGRWRSPSSMI
jgi:hypothetical protein